MCRILCFDQSPPSSLCCSALLQTQVVFFFSDVKVTKRLQSTLSGQRDSDGEVCVDVWTCGTLFGQRLMMATSERGLSFSNTYSICSLFYHKTFGSHLPMGEGGRRSTMFSTAI